MSVESQVNQFICKSLNTVPYIHFCHLNEKSFARHIALGEFYTGLPELVDTFAEACLSYPISLTYVNNLTYQSPEECLISLIDQATELHVALENLKYYGLTNQIESIITFTQGKLYKLQRLS